MSPRHLIPALAALAFAAPLAGQTPAPPSPEGEARVARAARVERAPVVDGKLDDAPWAAAPVLGGFVQREPLQGTPVSQRTEVRMVFDEQALYVGAWMYSADPLGIVYGETRRDADPKDVDAVILTFDTYLDRQNGLLYASTRPPGSPPTTGSASSASSSAAFCATTLRVVPSAPRVSSRNRTPTACRAPAEGGSGRDPAGSASTLRCTSFGAHPGRRPHRPRARHPRAPTRSVGRARPPFALERLHALAGIPSLASPQARLLYWFARPRAPTEGGSDGRTELVLSPLELLERLAAFVPPLRVHRHRYHGVLAPHARLRATVVAIGRPNSAPPIAPIPNIPAAPDESPRRASPARGHPP